MPADKGAWKDLLNHFSITKKANNLKMQEITGG